MALKQYKPTSPGRRHMTLSDRTEVTKQTPEKRLSHGKRSTGGRSNQGRISTKERERGAKRKYRDIDFRRDKDGVPARVAAIEYDPNRSARIALLHYRDGEKRYILSPVGLSVGDELLSGDTADFRTGNAMRIERLPLGVELHAIEAQPGGGAKLARSAGQAARLRAKEGKYAQVALPSGEIRLIHRRCKATIGRVANLEHSAQNLGKAGKNRYRGWRPHTRGVAMNPIDHPMGGGEGRSSGGRNPVSPTGIPAKGYRTRDKRKRSGKFIVQRRTQK